MTIIGVFLVGVFVGACGMFLALAIIGRTME
jgi:hypothetical protein